MSHGAVQRRCVGAGARWPLTLMVRFWPGAGTPGQRSGMGTGAAPPPGLKDSIALHSVRHSEDWAGLMSRSPDHCAHKSASFSCLST